MNLSISSKAYIKKKKKVLVLILKFCACTGSVLVDRHITFLYMKIHKNLAFDEYSSHFLLHSLFTTLENLKIDFAEFVLSFIRSLSIFVSQLIFLKRHVMGSRHAYTQVHLNSQIYTE